jgi:hypothetical protein
MSILQKRSTTAFETRLSILFRDAANFRLQLYELNKLRDQVRQAEIIGPDIERSSAMPIASHCGGAALQKL